MTRFTGYERSFVYGAVVIETTEGDVLMGGTTRCCYLVGTLQCASEPVVAMVVDLIAAGGGYQIAVPVCAEHRDRLDTEAA